MAGAMRNLSSEDEPISEINVTPFVDVVLVLLVIFMITAPALLKEAIGIQLPKASTSDGKTVQSLGVAINRQGQVLVNGVAVSLEELGREAARTIQADPGAQAIISADRDARHGDVVSAIDQIKSAGMNRFALQIERAQQP